MPGNDGAAQQNGLVNVLIRLAWFKSVRSYSAIDIAIIRDLLQLEVVYENAS